MAKKSKKREDYELGQLPELIKVSDLNDLVNGKNGEDPLISEIVGEVFLKLMTYIDDINRDLTSMKASLESKPDTERLQTLSEAFSRLEVTDLRKRITEAEMRIRQVSGDRMSIVKTTQSLNDLKAGISNLFQNNSPKVKGLHTTTGGAATEEMTNPRIEAGMTCIVTMQTKGATPVTIEETKCEDGKLVITFSADPSNDHVVNYVIL